MLRTLFFVCSLWLLAAVAVAQLDFSEAVVHEQLFRLSYNEAGLRGTSDADGIWQSLTSNAVDEKGEVQLDRVMSRMARHSIRTFPLDSPWRSVVGPKKLKHRDKLRTQRNSVSSAMTLDCVKPSTWKQNLNGTWSIDACFKLVDMTRKLVRGEIRTRCKGKPNTWGSYIDVEKRGIRSKMKEIICDRVRARVPGNTLSCPDLRADRTEGWKTRLANNSECTKNTFWKWMPRARRSSGSRATVSAADQQQHLQPSYGRK